MGPVGVGGKKESRTRGTVLLDRTTTGTVLGGVRTSRIDGR